MELPIYIGYKFKIQPVDPGKEILIAQLGEIGFESFVEHDKSVEAFIKKEHWFKTILNEIQILNSPEFEISFKKKEMPLVNWNQEWEKNFDPILVDDVCSIRASFHPKPESKYDIIINPKMSFGTGHHETTYMMVQMILQTSMIEKAVLDMGCGTGVLAILSEMVGASHIDAIDIDNWCYLNTLENIELNNCKNIVAIEGDATDIKNSYDVIIANINRNILLADIPIYRKHLKPNGLLLTSGFYKEDLESISNICNRNDLFKVQEAKRNNWMAVSYKLK